MDAINELVKQDLAVDISLIFAKRYTNIFLSSGIKAINHPFNDADKKLEFTRVFEAFLIV